jgi:hypothetical protein
MNELLVICAWCKKYLRGDKACPNVSHGICPECDTRIRKEMGLPPKQKRGQE